MELSNVGIFVKDTVSKHFRSSWIVFKVSANAQIMERVIITNFRSETRTRFAWSVPRQHIVVSNVKRKITPHPPFTMWLVSLEKGRNNHFRTAWNMIQILLTLVFTTAWFNRAHLSTKISKKLKIGTLIIAMRLHHP